MQKGKFIVIEGGDGSGKSSAVRWLKDELKEQNLLFTREPGGTENAEEIRNLTLKKREDDLDVFTQILLFEAARREHVMKKIIPALESGVNVISDRFSGATYGYQIVAGEGGEYEKIFMEIDAISRNHLEPDLIIFLDIEPEVGILRKQESGDELNTFDEKEIEFYSQVRAGIKKYLTERKHVIIDASAPKPEMRGEIKRAILSCIE